MHQTYSSVASQRSQQLDQQVNKAAAEPASAGDINHGGAQLAESISELTNEVQLLESALGPVMSGDRAVGETTFRPELAESAATSRAPSLIGSNLMSAANNIKGLSALLRNVRFSLQL